MSLKRKIFNIFAAVVMVFGSLPITFASTYADEPAGIVPEEENIPKSLKKVHSNNDGTYDITLEIEGVSSQKTDATKANVVVVFDTSGSMNEPTVFTASANGRYGRMGSNYVKLYRETGGFFSTCAVINNDSTTGTVYSDSDCNNRYSGPRYVGSNPNRMSVAKTAVKDLGEQLLSQNDPSDENLKDVVEIALVGFATDVNTTEGPTTSLGTFNGWIDDISISTGGAAGTNWEDALASANDTSFGAGDSDKTYIIFVSDGNPTFRNSQYGANNNDCAQWNGGVCSVWGNGQTDPSPHRNFNAAKEIADLIVADDNKELYAVGAFGDATNMRNIGGTYYDATDQTALNAAFAEIVDKIKAKYVGRFEGQGVFESKYLGSLSSGEYAAFTLPDIGIFAGEGVFSSSQINGLVMMQHEFGHVLQYRKVGIDFYYEVIAKESAMNCNNFFNILHMKKISIVVKIVLMLLILDIFSSCIMDRKTTLYIKNCTKDTLLIELSEADTLVNWQFWGKQAADVVSPNDTDEVDIAFNKAIIGSFALPDSTIYIAPYIYSHYDTCYLYTIKWNIAKKYSMDEIRAKKLYDRRTVTKKNFHNRLFEYKK